MSEIENAVAEEKTAPVAQEIKETQAQEPQKPEQEPQKPEQEPQKPEQEPQKPEKIKKVQNKKKRKRIKMIIGLSITLVVIAAVAAGILFLFNKKDNAQILTDFTHIGNIQTKITGSGATTPLVSETMKAEFVCTIGKVIAAVGDTVKKGDPLYSVDTTELKKTYDDAETELFALRREYKNLQKQPEKLREQIADLEKKLNSLNVKAPFSGKLMDVKVKAGGDISEGTVFATLVDDSTMRLTQFFSYAYEKDIPVGGSATISIPSEMSNIAAKVFSIMKVERISDEGTKLFEVTFVMKNPGTLTAGIMATASLKNAGGETITPYEAAALEYNKTEDIIAGAEGELLSTDMQNFAKVSAGESLATIKNTTYASQIEDLQDQIDSSQESLKATETKIAKQEEEVSEIGALIDDNVVYSPVSGMVTSINVSEGQVMAIDNPIITVSDSGVIMIEAKIDAMNIGNVQIGTQVDIIQYGMESEDHFPGVVESVSLEGKQENNFSYFPAKIRADNPEGKLLSGNWVNYDIIANEAFDCVVAPIQAVRYTDQGTVVFIKADAPPENVIDLGENVEVPEGFYAVPVEIGLSDNYSVEIKSGLAPETEIFTQYLTDQASSYNGGMGGGGVMTVSGGKG